MIKLVLCAQPTVLDYLINRMW